MTEHNALIQALNDLKLGSMPKAVAELKAGISSDEGINVDLLSKSVQSIKATLTAYSKQSIAQLVELYNKKLMAFRVSNMSCQHCHSSGWLKPVLIEGKYQDYMKTYQVNYYNTEKYFKFVQDNPSFRAFAGLLPCACDIGATHNHKFDQEWMTQEQRNRATGFCVKYQGEDANDPEDYYQGELIRCLNMAAQGLPYESRKLKEYPQDIKDLQKLLIKTLGEVTDG